MSLRAACGAAATAVVLAAGIVGGGAAAATSPHIAPGPVAVCSGTIPAPGSLAGGTYSNLVVNGVCDVNAGAVTVSGNVTVSSGGALVAAFGANASSLTVGGSIAVGSGATLVLGCEKAVLGPFPVFPCFDDNQAHPTLSSAAFVGGSINSVGALGILLHETTVQGDVVSVGGGGSPAQPGVFQSFPFAPPATAAPPPYSDVEDSSIGGNLSISGLQTVWVGALRNQVGGSVTFANDVAADPDAMEVAANTIGGNLICLGNSPANQYGDSNSTPDTVSGFASGQCSFSVTAPNPAANPMQGTPAGPATPIAVAAAAPPGYVLGAGDGGVFAYGNAVFSGSSAGTLHAPSIGIASAPGGGGYWIANSDGSVQSFGSNAGLFGAGAPLPLNKPVVGIAAAPVGDGFWEVALDGGVFGFGPGAPFEGSTGSMHLNQPVVGIAPVTTGNGYDLVAADGGVFAFGPGALFQGSMGGKPLNAPIVGIAIDPATGGYWLVAADGGIFAFGAPFFGSLGGTHINAPIVGMVASPTGNGYYLVGADGGVYAFPASGGPPFQGSAGGMPLNAPITGMALT